MARKPIGKSREPNLQTSLTKINYNFIELYRQIQVLTGGVVEFSAATSPPNEGNAIEVDVNNNDWTAHAHASGDSLEILVNEVATFTNDTGQLYRWIGTKPVTLGGTTPSYTAVSSDFYALDTNGFVPTTFTGAGTTGYVPDSITESGRILLDNGTWSPPAVAGAPEMIVQETLPPVGLYSDGQEWLRSSDMVKFTLYEGVSRKQWARELNGGGGEGGTGSSMIVQETDPDATLYEVGQEWLRTSDGVKFTVYESATSGKAWMRELNNGVTSPMIVQELDPDSAQFDDGQEWLRTSDMVKFTLYVGASRRQWIQEL